MGGLGVGKRKKGSNIIIFSLKNKIVNIKRTTIYIL